MTNRSPVVLCLLLAGASLADEANPPDIGEYMERREVCEHFRQEPWPEGSLREEKERREFIDGQFERFCKGSDQLPRDLRLKHKNNRTVPEKLKEYEGD